MIKQFLVYLFISFSNLSLAQLYLAESNIVKDLPMRITNTASIIGKYKSNTNLYCFGGIDSTLLFSGIHQKCFAYDSVSSQWRTLQDLPDSLGKIASSASLIKDTIYIVGGYYVFANSSEISSNRVHRFVPAIDSFISDAPSIPLPIDDQGQAVWRDSLLYIISGWSNTNSVADVQIYSPTNNSWQAGTSVPNNNFYKNFGCNATIIADTIYCFGGASAGANFPITNLLRKGVIDPSNPTQITWSYVPMPFNLFRYRGVVTHLNDFLVFAGGSKKTYNYNGQAYDGSGIVQPANSYYLYSFQYGAVVFDSTKLIINMDSRTVASDELRNFYILGGLDDSGKVSKECKKYNISLGSSVGKNIFANFQFDIYPNPSRHYFSLATNIPFISISIVNMYGKISKQFAKDSTNRYTINDLLPGNYFVQLNTKTGWVNKLLVVD